jgi:outer membrane protein assembly factor BamA
LYDTELAFPRLANEHLFVSLTARHRNYPRMQYYGPGPDSKKTGRSDYRLEDNRFGFTFGVRPVRPLYFGVTGDLLQVNIGPGTQRRWTNTEVQYTEAQAPGIQHQTDFLRGGVFAALDTRDIPGGPKSGTLLRADYVYYNDIDLQRNTHKRLNLQAQQYIPFFNKRRVIALRGKSDLTWKNPGQVVPFYLQPVLGGSDDLRGFRPFRFYDDNLILFNAEYRWEVFAGLDMAIFGDAGKVFHSKHDWNVRNMEGSYGVGMRFNARNAVFMRIDAGFSHEGWQLWLKFNNVF